jgi:hypothetical protein
LIDQNGYKKGVYSEKNSGHLQLFYFSKSLMYASVDNKKEKMKTWMKKEELKKCKCN